MIDKFDSDTNIENIEVDNEVAPYVSIYPNNLFFNFQMPHCAFSSSRFTKIPRFDALVNKFGEVNHEYFHKADPKGQKELK